MTQLNGPLCTNQIVNHFVSHSTSQNDKVQFDYLVTLDMTKTTCLDWHGGFFLHLTFLGIFLLEKSVEKTMNCNSVIEIDDPFWMCSVRALFYSFNWNSSSTWALAYCCLFCCCQIQRYFFLLSFLKLSSTSSPLLNSRLGR